MIYPLPDRPTSPGRLVPRPGPSVRSDLVGLPDGQVAAVGPGDRPLDQEQVVGRVDPDHLQVLDGDPRVAVLPGLLDALAGVGRVGAGAGRTGVAVHPLDAVRGPEALEPVPLHDAREATALAGPDDVDVL